MKLLRLDLLRYGHLTDVTLDFPPDALLHVVLGANEAGKSTALSAIGDALFGFPHTTPFAFQHQTAQLRLGFAVQARDGASGRFLRRKGTKVSLMDEAEQSLPEDRLARFLGGAGRDLFRTTYGLNSATLREGADALLHSGGEAGESLLAGMGLPHLRKALARLDEEARRLVGDGNRQRALSVAADAYAQQRRLAEAASVKPRDWVEAQEESGRCAAALEAARLEGRDLGSEAARLERVRRLLPILAQLDAQRGEFAGLADLPSMPAWAGAVFQRAGEALRTAQADHQREAAAAAALEAELPALREDPGILAVQDRLDLLAQRQPGIVEAAADLLRVQGDIATYRAAVQEAARDLGTAESPETVRDRVPTARHRARVQSLLSRRTELATRRAGAEDAVRSGERRRDQAEAMLAAEPPPPSTAPMRRTVQAARSEGPLDRQLDEAQAVLDRAERQLASGLAALPLWQADATALAGCRVPLLAETDATAARLATTSATLAAASQAAADDVARIADLEIALAQLARGETVPTREVIAQARTARDRIWRLVRDALAGAAPGPEDPAAGTLPATFEALRDAADRHADARADDAQRVNDYATRKAELDQRCGRRDAACQEIERARDAAAAAEAAWVALWAPAGIHPQGPAAMAEWRRDRTDVLRLAEAAAAARQDRDGLAARRDAAMDALRRALEQPVALRLASLLDEADAACRQAEDAEAAHRKRVAARDDEAARLPDLVHQLREAEDALERFAADWSSVTTSLGLPADAGSDSVEAALHAWTRVADTASAWRNDAGRVEQMQGAVDAFESAVQGIVADLGGGDPAEPASLTVIRLARRLADARRARDAAQGRAEAIATRRADAEGAAHRIRQAEAELAILHRAAGTATLAALETAIGQAERREALRRSIDALQAAMQQGGDGLAEEKLRAERQGIEIDLVPTRLAEIAAAQAALGDRLAELGATQATVAARIASMESGGDAAHHAQEARHNLAEAGMAAERYARLHVARTLLHAGIERVRSERQGPLLADAGRHFRLLTGGDYVRLSADEDEAGRAILHAVGESGVECPVEALSEATRNQFYLALRIAAIEAHAAAAEPLPFIADDLLMTFDEGRAAAAISVLIGLGRTTQTILFTHHAHIAEMARGRCGVRVQELPSRAVGNRRKSDLLPAA